MNYMSQNEEEFKRAFRKLVAPERKNSVANQISKAVGSLMQEGYSLEQSFRILEIISQTFSEGK